jgi:DNA primase
VCFMGTAATEHQMETLWEITGKGGPDPVLCFDGDRAGQAAAAAAAARFLPLLGPGRTVRFALLQGAHDPASLLDQEGGRNVLLNAIESAKAAPMVLYHQELAALPRTPSPEEVAAFDARVRDRILNEIRDKSLQGAYRDEFWRLKRQRSNPRAVILPTGAPAAVASSCREAALLSAILLNPTLFNEFGEDMAGWEMPTPALEALRGRIVDVLSPAMDDEDLVCQSRAFIEENADAAALVMSEAVFSAAPFVRPGASLEVVVAGMRRVLVDMQVAATKREVARLTALLQNPESGGEVQDILRRLPLLLEQLREQSSN